MELTNTQTLVKYNWQVLNLGESAILKARIGWQGLTTAEYLEFGNYYLITGTDFKDGFIDWDNCVFVEKNRYDQDTNIQIKVDDVLVTKDGTIGKVAFVDKVPKPTTLNSGVFVIRPKNNAFDSKYFYYVLMSNFFKDFLSRLTAGSTISHLYQKDFVHFNFPLPPTLEEQKAIAQVLSDTDALIQALEKKIAKKKLIKKGVMQKLLTPKEDWEEAKIEDLIYSFQNGYGFNASGYEKNGVPIVTMAQIGLDGSFQFDERKVNYWRQEDFNSLKSYHLNNGDVIIAMTDVTPDKNLIGRMTIVETKRTLLLNQRVGLLRINRDLINPLFLTTISNMSSWRSYCIGSASLGVQANIGTKDILNGNIMIPEIEEQNKIAQILSDMEKEIMNLKEKLSKYQITKQGMMQQLLTGKIRLV